MDWSLCISEVGARNVREHHCPLWLWVHIGCQVLSLLLSMIIKVCIVVLNLHVCLQQTFWLQKHTLGGRVKIFGIEWWKRHAKDIMQIGLTLKVSQKELCYNALEATGKTTLIEASARQIMGSRGWILKTQNSATVSFGKAKIGWERFWRMYDTTWLDSITCP